MPSARRAKRARTLRREARPTGDAMDLDAELGMDDVRYADPGSRGSELDEGLFDSLMQRAVGEQIAEQRLIRQALTDFDRRLEMLERTVSDRLALVEREASERADHFERSVTERMLTFETVLKRIVDRLTSAEEHIVEAVDHGTQVTRTQLDALRPTVEGAVERLSEAADDSERVISDVLAKTGGRLEAMVRDAMDAELRSAIDEFRSSLATAERKIRRDVNRLTFAERSGDVAERQEEQDEIYLRGDEDVSPRVSVKADRVDPTGNGNGHGRDPGRRRRERPLRARRADD